MAVVVVGVDLAAVQVGPLGPAHHVQRVAGPDHQVGVLAGFERADPVADAQDARRVARILESRGQAKDHPILLNVPETSYLKCLVVTVN